MQLSPVTGMTPLTVTGCPFRSLSNLTNSVSAAWDAAKPHLKEAAVKTASFLRTAPGLSLIAFLGGAVLAVSAQQLHSNRVVNLIMQICAYTLFAAAGVALGVGLVYGFSAPLI